MHSKEVGFSPEACSIRNTPLLSERFPIVYLISINQIHRSDGSWRLKLACLHHPDWCLCNAHSLRCDLWHVIRFAYIIPPVWVKRKVSLRSQECVSERCMWVFYFLFCWLVRSTVGSTRLVCNEVMLRGRRRCHALLYRSGGFYLKARAESVKFYKVAAVCPSAPMSLACQLAAQRRKKYAALQGVVRKTKHLPPLKINCRNCFITKICIVAHDACWTGGLKWCICSPDAHMRLAGERHMSLITCTLLDNTKHDMNFFLSR